MVWIKTLMQDSEPSTTLNESLFWQYELEHQQESGVVFFNKAIPSAFMSLLFSAYMNTMKVKHDVYSNVAGTYSPASSATQSQGKKQKNLQLSTSYQATKKLSGSPLSFRQHPTPSRPITPA